jgi:hypothetical protein
MQEVESVRKASSGLHEVFHKELLKVTKGNLCWVTIAGTRPPKQEMTKSKKATEYDLLRLFVTEMEKEGVTRGQISFDIDQATVDLMRERLGVNATLEEIQRFADKCLAHEWLEHVLMGTGQYGALSLYRSRKLRKQSGRL